ncbi:LacI family DNA-binding transcriptional regulator [Lederbergia wuyishanensis]|uniref:LacI family transcriptional regulator n=1 Tax=Lederbergia wuyishanensis TaxID=1347903 RepID=A0ABU0D906_9BACI|nr:LacI family DNA-binding transcriptional regulator [Lederbergia wuyishanensis]MCJ8009486.1 LacI family transcriptional regulator [Lederbergia wuyishanensis]MDQ0344904.1 LacI family transcriptional regulator [Lederbergia wuyishanensis]
MSVTIKDIAKIAGVSYSTVSKALNDSPLVKPMTKKRILKVAKEMGYKPNFAAQRLVSKQTKIIGLIWPTIERVVLSTLVTNISNEIRKTPYSMILSVEPIPSSLDTFRRFQVDGVILFDENIDISIEPNSIPFLVYGVAENENNHYPIVDPNHEQAMLEAVKYLHSELGHTNIAYIGDFSKTDRMQMEKLKGFKKAMNHFGLSIDQQFLVDTHGLDWYDGYQAVSKLLESTDRPTAIVGGSYDISGGILRGLKEKKLQIPTDISIISYDNIPQMANMEIPLSSIGVPVDQLAAEIVRSIIEIIENKKIDPSIRKMIPELNIRQSCGKMN